MSKYNLDINDVAERLCVSRMTVWQWTRKKRIAYTRIGRAYWYSEQDVEEFLARGRVEYEPETVAEAVTA